MTEDTEYLGPQLLSIRAADAGDGPQVCIELGDLYVLMTPAEARSVARALTTCAVQIQRGEL